MEHEVKKAFEMVVDYFAVQLNPAQMDKFGEVLTGMIQNTLDCMSMTKARNAENLLDDLEQDLENGMDVESDINDALDKIKQLEAIRKEYL